MCDRNRLSPAQYLTVKRLDGFPGIFADYVVSRKDADRKTAYTVELRSLDLRANFCTCPDFKKNYLGTCKHVEKILLDEDLRRLFKMDLSLISDDTEADAIVRKCAKMDDLVHEILIKSSF
jgi:hypothetical protein